MRLLPLLVVTMALAGCAGEQGDPVEPVIVTDPSQAIDNSTIDRPHLHDYWAGKDAYTVMDGSYNTGGIVFSDSLDFDFRSDPDRVVPQGTAHVNVTLSWADSGVDVYGITELWVKTAADASPELVQEITSGDTVTVASDNDQNDLPHQRLSGWVFRLVVYSDNAASQISFNAEVTVTVVAHRGLEIPLYPGHPDQWQDQTEIQLLESPTIGPGIMGGSQGNQYCLSGCLERFGADEGAIVPLDADHVEVTITMGLGHAGTIGLAYHHSATWDFQNVEPDEDGDVRVYRIPVDGNGDGPYAKQSLWEFIPVIDSPGDVYEGDYQISARVLKEG